MALKFAGKFKNGDFIRAYDFKPVPGRSSCFIEGKIIDANYLHDGEENSYHCFKIELTKRVYSGGEQNHLNADGSPKIMFVPHQISVDYDERIRQLTPPTLTGSVIKVSLDLEINDAFCLELLHMVIDGASTGWLAYSSFVRNAEGEINSLIDCYDTEDDSTRWQDLDIPTIREGCRKILSKEVEVSPTIYQSLLSAVLEYDTSDCDADVVDCVAQAGLLGDIVYG